MTHIKWQKLISSTNILLPSKTALHTIQHGKNAKSRKHGRRKKWTTKQNAVKWTLQRWV